MEIHFFLFVPDLREVHDCLRDFQKTSSLTKLFSIHSENIVIFGDFFRGKVYHNSILFNGFAQKVRVLHLRDMMIAQVDLTEFSVINIAERLKEVVDYE